MRVELVRVQVELGLRFVLAGDANDLLWGWAEIVELVAQADACVAKLRWRGIGAFADANRPVASHRSDIVLPLAAVWR